MFFLKIFGVVLIVASSAYAGILKSGRLVKRYEKLSLVSDGVDELYNYIGQGEFELERAIKNAFCKCDFLRFQSGDILCDDDTLKNDKKMIEEFFKQLGHSSKKIECDRIDLFKFKLKSQLNEAQNDIAQKGRIYKTLGVCFGLIIGILLI
ncbi:MAG: stage III sporulation protein AB [Clostridia bacterium]|nr:stage III sporulation protein AB [Clostridia bacterium]